MASPSPAKHARGDGFDEIRCARRHQRGQLHGARHRGRYRHLMQMRQRAVDRGEVHVHDRLALAAVGLADRLLDMGDRLFAWQHAGDGEEAGLQDRVRPQAQPELPRDGGSVDHEQPQMLVDDCLLHRAGQVAPNFVRRIGRVEQEGRAGCGDMQQILPLQEHELVAGDETGLGDQVRRLDRGRPEAQMRDGLRARFMRVVDEIPLGIQPGILGDDLHAVLVGADRAVRAQAEEHGARSPPGFRSRSWDRRSGWNGSNRR